MKKIFRRPFFIRLINWEYWPFHVVYGLLYPYWFWLCVKARSLFFFSASNPTMENGGFLMESKKKIYDLMPQKHYPRTIFFEAETPPKKVWRQIEHGEFLFPLIGKPDIGMRGMAVKKLHDKKELFDYVSSSRVNFLIQEFIPYEMEAGIFYYRLPNEEKGHVSGIVYKEFLTVTGDGQSTILKLLQKDERCILQLPALKEQFSNRLNDVLPAGVEEIIVPYGNHARGAKFLDASSEIDETLTAVIDELCRQVDGFYYGRMDVRFQSWEDLRKGINFSIVELNGAGSEPTHIYDPKHSIFFAWKEIVRHWNILYKISKQNRQHAAYMGFRTGIKMFRDNFSYLKLLNAKHQNRCEDQRRLAVPIRFPFFERKNLSKTVRSKIKSTPALRALP
jgi:hypothetical protein